MRGIDDQRALRLVELHDGADRLGELHRPPHVLDRRDVAQHGAALRGHQRRRDHLECRVLRTLDEYRPAERRPAAYAVANLGALGHVDTAPVRGGAARRLACLPCGTPLASALSSMPPTGGGSGELSKTVE